MQIGERLRIARDTIGYTLEKVAAETGIGQSSLCEFENGKREPRFSQLSRLAEFYKRPLEFFLSDKSPIEDIMLWREPPPNDEQIKETEAQFRQLCEQFHRLELLMNEPQGASLPQARARDQFTFTMPSLPRIQAVLVGEIPSAL
jgi:transcriptional regulator with XRE-family HTH domain